MFNALKWARRFSASQIDCANTSLDSDMGVLTNWNSAIVPDEIHSQVAVVGPMVAIKALRLLLLRSNAMSLWKAAHCFAQIIVGSANPAHDLIWIGSLATLPTCQLGELVSGSIDKRYGYGMLSTG